MDRREHRPTFIEAVTYRLGDHTTADDARRYRDQAEVELWQKRDPLLRLRKFLLDRSLWDDARQKALEARAKEEIAAVVRRAEEIDAPIQSDFFDAVYAEIPPEVRRQRNTMRTSSIGLDPSQIADQDLEKSDPQHLTPNP